MIKVWIISWAAILLATLASCSQAPAPVEVPKSEQPSPPFTFKHMTRGTTTLEEANDAGLVWHCNAGSGERATDTYCDLKGETYPDIPHLADVSLLDTFVTFEHGLFQWFILEFHTDQFDHVISVLREAYGEPCRTGSEVLQNGFGATFADDNVVWCFDGGSLNADRHMKSNVSHGELTFEVDHPTVARPAYDPNSL